jgi:hypothetical protein
MEQQKLIQILTVENERMLSLLRDIEYQCDTNKNDPQQTAVAIKKLRNLCGSEKLLEKHIQTTMLDPNYRSSKTLDLMDEMFSIVEVFAKKAGDKICDDKDNCLDCPWMYISGGTYNNDGLESHHAHCGIQRLVEIVREIHEDK